MVSCILFTYIPLMEKEPVIPIYILPCNLSFLFYNAGKSGKSKLYKFNSKVPFTPQEPNNWD